MAPTPLAILRRLPPTIPRFSSTAATSTTTTTTTWHSTLLTHRSLLSITGPDATPFLEGLVTNHIPPLPHSAPSVITAAFLTPKGRLFYDCFLYPMPKGQGWWVDHPKEGTGELARWMQKFVLRRKVKLGMGKGWGVGAVWGGQHELGDMQQIGWAEDVRAGKGVMGYRGPTPTSDSSLPFPPTPHGLPTHHLTSYLSSLSPSLTPTTPALSLPLTANLDYTHSVDFKKGCYVGQELTARTKWTGVVRKRAVRVIFSPNSQPPPTSTSETLVPVEFAPKGTPLPPLPDPLTSLHLPSAPGKPIGKLSSSIHAFDLSTGQILVIGLAVVKVDVLPNVGELDVVLGAVEWRGLVRRPEWWPAPAEVGYEDQVL